MAASDPLIDYLLRLGDNGLILGHRLSEWVGHGPAIEEELAVGNVALDLLGQARMWLSLAGRIEGDGRDEDQLAYLRDAGAFRNLLLLEQPNGRLRDDDRAAVSTSIRSTISCCRALSGSSDPAVARSPPRR
jgi:ring-1,2-phenylacetyl-CoA epoxidase subunit PaaC